MFTDDIIDKDTGENIGCQIEISDEGPSSKKDGSAYMIAAYPHEMLMNDYTLSQAASFAETYLDSAKKQVEAALVKKGFSHGDENKDVEVNLDLTEPEFRRTSPSATLEWMPYITFGTTNPKAGEALEQILDQKNYQAIHDNAVDEAMNTIVSPSVVVSMGGKRTFP